MSEQAQFGFAFEPETVDQEIAQKVFDEVTQEKPRVDPTACPKCGGKSQVSIRPVEMGGTRYCSACQGEEGCFYFTPVEYRPAKDDDPNLDDSGMAITEPEEVEEETAELPVQSHVEIERNGQIPLINIGEWWEEHWKGMPEFVQKDLKPFKTIYVHFENREDMEAFALLVGQRIGLNTRSIWHPEAGINDFSKTRYICTEREENIEDESIEVLDEEE